MHCKATLAATLLAAAVLAAGCSSGVESSKKADYRNAVTLPPLEVPPGLTEPVPGDDAMPALDAAGNPQGEPGPQVLPPATNVEVVGRGEQRWLVVDADPAKVWGEVGAFWKKSGFELKVEKPQLGIMETQWAENRADIPESFIRGALEKVVPGLYSAPTRDKFRIRLEQDAPGKTEVYLTHYGVKQVTIGDNTDGSDKLIWEVRPSDPELANEMLNRLVAYLGTGTVTSTTALKPTVVEEPPRATLATGTGEPTLVDQEGFARAWRRTGLALDRIGFVVEDRNRAAGIYYVRAVDELADAGVEEKPGWLSRLFSGDDKQAPDPKAQVVVEAAGDNVTRITLRDSAGKPYPAEHAKAILTKLEQQLH